MSTKIGIIVGSTRPTRVGRTIADWLYNQVKDTPDVSFDIIDLKEVNLPFLDEPGLPSAGNYQNEHTKKWGEKIAQYDGYIFVTPEYNHGIAAPLKNAIDTIHAEWDRKPVAFVGYGALGGARAIEQLVQVTAQINMVPLPSSAINIIDVWAAIDDQGQVRPENMRGKVDNLTDKLVWWTNVLKDKN